jgi:heme o synthase
MICKKYLSLTKPGIIVGNLIPAVGGFALASHGFLQMRLLGMTMLGLALVIASACVWNNYFDRRVDKMMARTQSRPLVQGLVSGKEAIFLATFLGLLGFVVLMIWTPLLTVGVALAGVVGYVVFYGISKYRTSYGTLIGSFAGAMPPVVGYTAVSHRLDIGAFILFAMMVLWQMPHFFAIAIRRLDDYKAAAIPVLPAVKGIFATKVQMVIYVVAFVLASILLAVFGFAGGIYLTVVSLIGVVWIGLAFFGFRTAEDQRWAKQMFMFSLVAILGVFGLLLTPFR